MSTQPEQAQPLPDAFAAPLEPLPAPQEPAPVTMTRAQQRQEAGRHTLTPSRSHAAARTSRFGHLASLFRGHHDLPAPVTDLQDDGGRVNVTGTLEPLPPAPAWHGASVTAGNPLPALARGYVPAPPAEVIPFVPLTEPPVIFDALRGDERLARPCRYCGTLHQRGDLSWRDDAFGCWSCPACQMRPDWRAPSLPGLPAGGMHETGILARTLLGTDPRCVRQRPDGKWTAAISVDGRRKLLGAFGSKEKAELVYGAVLRAFADAAAERRAA